MECHVSGTDPFSIAGTEARADRYGVSGIPQVQVDGKFAVVGAGSCAAAKANYLNRYNTRMTETGGVSAVDITGSFQTDETGGSYSIRLEQLDPGTFNAHQVTFFLYEDDVTWCCGFGGVSNWNGVCRVVETVPASLDAVGEIVDINGDFLGSEEWNLDNLHAVAIFEEIAGQKTVVQAGALTQIFDFKLTAGARVGSVPEGNGTVFFEATVQNISTGPDVLDIDVSGPAGWTAEFQVEGDPTYYTDLSVPLAATEAKDVLIRIQTDGAHEIRNYDLGVTSQVSTRSTSLGLRVFNDSPAVLFVDDDNNGTFETIFESELPACGYLFDDWNAYVEHQNNEPKLVDMLGYDVIVYETGQGTGVLLDDAVEADLQAYLDGGGKVFLNSMDCLTSNLASTFWSDYMGVSTWVINTKAHTATGEALDPITDGMVLSVTFSSEALNRVDNLTPAAGATVILRSEIGNNPAAVRRDIVGVPGARSVFSTVPLHALSTSDADPNNAHTFFQRTMIWLLGGPATDVEPGVLTGTASGLLGASPNPFLPSTSLRFVLTSAASSAPVSLTLVDAGGREVRRLLREGSLEAGTHSIEWDGRDDLGHEAAQGMYFAVLATADGKSTSKVVRLR